MDVFPSSLFPPSKLRWKIAGSPVTGGQPISGPPATSDLSVGGWWVAEFSVGKLWRPNDIKAWRALSGRLRNGAVAFMVPCLDWFQPWPSVLPNGAPSVPHSDGASFLDGSLYAGGAITASLSADAALRDTTATIAVTVGAALTGGEYFSLTGASGNKRLHLIHTVETEDGTNYSIGFTPPLREDYAEGAAVDFQSLGCTMKLGTDALDDVWMTMEAPFKASPSIRFAETDC